MATQDDGAMALDETVPRRTVRLWTAGLVVLCIGALLLLFRNIGATVPYPQHTDEGFVSGPAANILVTGQLHPQRFNYPSFPTYLAATAMSLGFLRGAANLEIRDVNAIGRVGYPHYETPRVMQTARQAFALLAVVCLAMTGLSAWLTFRRPSTMVVAPLLLLTCPLFFKHAWLYLNVDIVAASFVMLTLAACLLGIARLSTRQSAIVPGIFAGLATAGKYTLAIAILPVLLAIGLYVARSRMIWTWAVALAAMVIAFLVAVPYSLVDIPGFLNGVGYEVFHYASGHAGFAGEPGLGAAGLLPAAFPHGIRLRRISARPGRHRGHHTRELATSRGGPDLPVGAALDPDRAARALHAQRPGHSTFHRDVRRVRARYAAWMARRSGPTPRMDVPACERAGPRRPDPHHGHGSVLALWRICSGIAPTRATSHVPGSRRTCRTTGESWSRPSSASTGAPSTSAAGG